ncbi:MAG: MFS transporter [Acidimicrobiales bacterium]
MTATVDSRRAWGVAAGAALANGIGFGTVYSFGAFFDAMATEFNAGRGATALVFSLTLLGFFGFGAISGALADRFGPRAVLGAGAVLFCGGLVATSQAQSLAVGYLTYGIGVGIGAGCWITPMLATVGAWFDRRRPHALGLTAAGSGLGTLILSPTTARLIDTYGWRRADLVLAGVGAVGLSVAMVAVKRSPVPRPARAGAHLRAVSRTRAFRLLFISSLFMSAALYVPFTFVVSFAKADGVAPARAALLIGLIGASSIVGRLGLMALSGRLGSLRLYQLCLSVQVLAYLLWLAADGRYPLLVGFAVVLGVAYGGFVALGPEVLIGIFGATGLGSVLGLVYLGSGVGGFLGPVLSGAVADATGTHAWPIAVAVVFAATSTAVTMKLRDGPALPGDTCKT